MDENFFILINLILLGIAGIAILLYLVIITRKRLKSGFTHPLDKSKPQSPTSTHKDLMDE